MPELTPPDNGQKRYESAPLKGGKHSVSGISFINIRVLLGIFILLDIGILVWFILPHRESKPISHHAHIQIQGEKTGQHADDEAIPEKRAGVEDAAAAWLSLQAKAEAEGIALWGGKEYSASVEMAVKANEQASKKEYYAAQQDYLSATKRLKGLLALKPEILASAIRNGKNAMEHQNSAEAVSAFKMALAIDPENPVARHGLKRAENLDRVVAFYRQGLAEEKGDDLIAARTNMEKALKTDPEFTPARIALNRVNIRLRDITFKNEMDNFFRALKENNFTVAHNALNKASLIKPDDPSVREAVPALKEAENRTALLRLQEEYMAAAKAEKWQHALKICAEAKKIDPDAAFFIQKEREAKNRLDLDQVLQSILSRPERLQEEGPLAEALDTLKTARSVSDIGPRLMGQIEALDRLISDATSRVKVVLHSDNLTSVTLYRVGYMGKFFKKRLLLHPGTYTVVGRRPGYRDVRQTFRVTSRRKLLNIYIRCEEHI